MGAAMSAAMSAGRDTTGCTARGRPAGATRRPWRRRVTGGLAMVALVSGFLVVAGSPALAARGEVAPSATASTFTVHDDGSVHVDVAVTIVNHDSCPAGYVCFYDATAIAVPTVASGLSSDGGSIHAEGVSAFFERAVVSLSSNLVTGASRVIHVSYDISGGARSNPFVRTNRAYVEFFAFGVGDPGRVDVTITVPDEFDSTVDFASMERNDDGHTTTYHATAITNPDSFTAAFTARNDTALVHRSLVVAGHTVDLRSWPGDTGWADFVANELTRGVPALESLVRARLPKTNTLTITETAAPYLYGYAGWYTDINNSIEIGDDLDATVVLHEVSHEWFNRGVFSDRWINEGLAQDFSTLAVSRLGGKLAQPDPVDPNAAGHVTLDDWSAPQFRSDTADAEERFGYNASFYVIRTLADEIGPIRMDAVLGAAMRGDITYLGIVHSPEHEAGGFGWRQLLDLLDNTGHARTADALFAKLVATVPERAEMAARTTARASYAGLVARSGTWGAPRAVRQAMHDWNFGAAAPAVSQARKVLDLRDATQRLLAPLHVALPASLQQSYEQSASLDTVVSAATALHAAAQSLSAARSRLDAGRNVWQRIGLIGADAQRSLVLAEQAFARGDLAATARDTHAVSVSIGDASRVGQRRTAITGAVILALVLVLFGVRRLSRRRARRAEERAAAARAAETAGEPDDDSGAVAVGSDADADADADPGAVPDTGSEAGPGADEGYATAGFEPSDSNPA